MKKNISLKKYTTFQIGGAADFFVSVKNEKELVQTIEKAHELQIPFFIIGGGSNVLFSDNGYRGIILKNETRKVEIRNSKKVFAESGASLAKVLSFCLAHNLSGLEWTAGIPGTIGGAVKGNAGAFQRSMKDSVVSVKVYNTKDGKTKILKNKECFFQYRGSVFKKKNSYIILGVEMKFQEANPVSINEKIKFYLAQRKEKQPHGFSAGSVFKNYEIKNEKEKKEISKEYPEIEPLIKDNMIPAAFLIEKADLKGKTIGRAMISRVHANFIINLGQAKSSDVSKLIAIIEKEVEKKFGIVLEKEIVVVE